MKKKIIVGIAAATMAMTGLSGTALAAHSSVVTPNGVCHDTTGNAAGKAQGKGAQGRPTWQNSLEGQETADDNNDVTQANAQCPAE